MHFLSVTCFDFELTEDNKGQSNYPHSRVNRKTPHMTECYKHSVESMSFNRWGTNEKFIIQVLFIEYCIKASYSSFFSTRLCQNKKFTGTHFISSHSHAQYLICRSCHLVIGRPFSPTTFVNCHLSVWVHPPPCFRLTHLPPKVFNQAATLLLK